MDLAAYFRPKAPAPVERRAEYSIGDPALAAFLGLSTATASGESVTASTAMGLTAVYRSVALIAGTIATLPLKSYRTTGENDRDRVKSFLDDPGGPDGPTAYEWKETLVAHLLLHGNAYGLTIRNEAGAILGIQLLEPSSVSVKAAIGVPGGKVFTVRLAEGGTREFTAADITHIPALSSSGIVGLSPISVARQSIGTALAGDKAAGRMFSNGLLIGGIVSVDDDVNDTQAKAIKDGLKANVAGADRAGDIAVVNRNLTFSPWTMNAHDAQFIESRGFQVEEVARIFGVPKVLLAEDGASTWGSGIAELVRGMQRFTLAPWTARIEQRLSRLLASPRFCEFDFAGLLAPTPTEVTANMAAEIEAGLLTIDEGRRLLNRAAAPASVAQEAPE